MSGPFTFKLKYYHGGMMHDTYWVTYLYKGQAIPDVNGKPYHMTETTVDIEKMNKDYAADPVRFLKKVSNSFTPCWNDVGKALVEADLALLSADKP
jgi:hypothetical protein